MKENCNCAAHSRNDAWDDRYINGTYVLDFTAVTYVDRYAVTTQALWSPQQAIVINLLNLFPSREEAHEAASTMPSVREGATLEQLFQADYQVLVVEVGDKPVAEAFGPDIVKYSNHTEDATSAMDLHNELVVMINAGTFNGENL